MMNKTLGHLRSQQARLQRALKQTPLRHNRGVWSLSAIALLTTVTIASIQPADVFVPAARDMALMPPTQILDIADIHGDVTHTVIPGYAGNNDTHSGSDPAPRPELWTEIKVKRGDTLAGILAGLQLDTGEIARYSHTNPDAKQLYRLFPGQMLKLQKTSSGQLQELVYPASANETLHLRRTDNGFEFNRQVRQFDTRQVYTTGFIQSSLFLDGQNAGLTDAQVMQLVDIFGWDIDFALDLRVGDSFSAVHEENYLNGQKAGDGPILAAEFVNQGKTYRAIGYRDASGTLSYFSPDGMSLRRAFLRSPVKFSRITSRFNLGRFHPILKTWRAHAGVDYGAPTGTPIMATASGRVIFVGIKGGYGNAVILRHGGTYSTLYAHLSRFKSGLKTGSYVEQGEIIGYVGKTGLATGPHLHYEFQVDGVHRNPLTFKFPQAEPIRAEQKREFQQSAEALGALLDQLGRTSVAQAP